MADADRSREPEGSEQIASCAPALDDPRSSCWSAFSPKIGTLIIALENAAPAMFNTLTEQAQKQIELSDQPRSSDAAPIEAYRVVLSDYVVLLGRLNAAWTELVSAVKQPSNAVSLGALTQTSSQVVSDAAVVRQSLARLPRGDATN
jgi:hypothetical protein